MRTADLAPPAVTPHPIPPGAPAAAWPGRLVIAVEQLPQAAYVWDDADADVTWDDTTPERVWDAPFIGSGFTDVFCDFQALTIESGEPDELGLYPPSQITLSLANPDGRYTTRSVDGRLVFYAPGRPLDVWWVDPGGVAWWLFAGDVAAWDEHADGTVTVEAFDGFAELAQEPGVEWTPGVAGELPRARITSILSAFGYTGPTRLDLGTNVLATVPVDLSPLDAVQTVALSDGGVVKVDADGALFYTDRGWRAGRDDQTTVPVFSDNVCTVPNIVWDLELATNDDGLATSVVLTNLAELTATAAVAANDPNAWFYGAPRYRLTHPDPDWWTTQADGNELARHLLEVRSTPAVSVGEFTLYVHDPQQDLWMTAIDRRIGDRLRFIRDRTDPDGSAARLDVETVLLSLRHEITPDTWLTTMATTRAVAYTDALQWDVTLLTWDDPSPSNVWSY